MDDFSTVKVGDKLWSPIFGWGKVRMVDSSFIFIIPDNEKIQTHSFHVKGGSHLIGGPQCLFWDEVEMIPPPKPKKIVVIEDVIWRADYYNTFPISRSQVINWSFYRDKPPMKMTLTWEE